MRHFCTYFDINYLTRALVLYQSLQDSGIRFTLWALCLDEQSAGALSQLDLPGLVVVPLADLEAYDGELLAAKPTRSVVEYYFTLTPALPLYVLSLRPDIDAITYLDADLRFWASPDLVLDELASASVLIIPHGFPRFLQHLESHGKYNVGMVAFRNDENGRACLERWHRQCLEWCYDRVEDGRFADQAYLDDWPGTLAGVAVIDRPGVGLGPWNFMRYEIDVAASRPMVDGQPLVFYHFHGFRSLAWHLYDDGLAPYGRMPAPARIRIYGSYIRDLRRARRRIRGLAQVAHRGVRPGGHASVREFLRLARHRRLLYELGGHVLG